MVIHINIWLYSSVIVPIETYAGVTNISIQQSNSIHRNTNLKHRLNNQLSLITYLPVTHH